MNEYTKKKLGCLVMSLYFGGASVALYGAWSDPSGGLNTKYSKIHEVRKIEGYLEDLNNRTIIVIYHPNSSTKALGDIEREEPLLWQESKYCLGLNSKGFYHFTPDDKQMIFNTINDVVATRISCVKELKSRLETIIGGEAYPEEKKSYDAAQKKASTYFYVGGVLFLLGVLGMCAGERSMKKK